MKHLKREVVDLIEEFFGYKVVVESCEYDTPDIMHLDFSLDTGYDENILSDTCFAMKVNMDLNTRDLRWYVRKGLTDYLEREPSTIRH